jgi:hypothetical protein
MKEMNFSIGVYALKEVKITIYNEELFKLRSKEFFEKEKRKIELDDLEGTYFEDCVTIEQGFFDWEDEDIEETDEFYELIDNYLNEIKINY